MEISLILYSPMFLVWIKMLLVTATLLLIQSKLSGSNQARMWQSALVLLLLMPWISNHFSLVNIPVLPLTDSYSFVTESALYVTTQLSSSMPAAWLVVFLLAALASTYLLIQIILQVKQIQTITQSAQAIENKSWSKVSQSTANALGLKKTPRIMLSKQLQSPCTWGAFQPVILLPSNIQNLNQLSIILHHEMAHIKRHDWAWMMASKITCALFWFNPMFWLIHHKLIHSFESACDELVLIHEIKPSLYAETLLHFHQKNHGQPHHIATSMAQPSAMFLRLQNILTPQSRSHHMQHQQQKFTLVFSTVLLILITFSQLSFAHQDNQSLHSATIAQTPPTPVTAPKPQQDPEAPQAPSADVEELIILPKHPTAPTQPTAPLSPPVPTNEHPATKSPQTLQAQVQKLKQVRQLQAIKMHETQSKMIALKANREHQMALIKIKQIKNLHNHEHQARQALLQAELKIAKQQIMSQNNP